MTKLKIDGVVYDLDAAIEEISNGTIKAMAKQSALVGDAVTMEYLENQQVRLEAMQKEPDFSALKLGGDVGYIDVNTAYIFIVKRHAGEQITWEQAEAYGPNDVEQVEDEPTPEVPADPKDEAPAADEPTA